MDDQELTYEGILERCRPEASSRLIDLEEGDIRNIWTLTVQNIMSDIDTSELIRIAAMNDDVLYTKVRLKLNESMTVETLLMNRLEEVLVEELVEETLDSFR